MWDLVGFVTGSKSVAKLVLLRCCWSPLTGAARAFSPPLWRWLHPGGWISPKCISCCCWIQTVSRIPTSQGNCCCVSQAEEKITLQNFIAKTMDGILMINVLIIKALWFVCKEQGCVFIPAWYSIP